ncbi:MAG: hypothetical protein WC395_09485 [Bacteroidales bacterium]|jgi:hypothetical protein
MLRTVHTFFCILMIGTFLTGSAGLSVHRCLHDGSVNIFLFSGSSSCGEVHGKEFTCHAGCSEHHDENCCSTRVFMVDDPVVSAQDLLSEGYPDTPVQELLFSEGVTGNLLKTGDPLPAHSLFKPPLDTSVYPGAHLVPLRL